MENHLAAGTRLGQYVVVEPLGEGDFAVTYAATEAGGDRVALKVLHAQRGDALERLDAEIAALKRFDDVGIPAFIDEGESEHGRFLAMTLAPGRSLRDRLKERSAKNSYYSDLETLWVARQLLSSLQHIGKPSEGAPAGWVHRDIKDANVMVNGALDRVTLIDFGFCKENGASDRRLSDSFFRAGAARYSPPSKLHSPAEARAGHDVFAVGVLMYQMLTNSFPWSVDIGDVGQLGETMLRQMPPSVSDLNSTVHREVSDLVESLIRTNDLYRPTASDALEVTSHLIDQLERQGGQVSEPRLVAPLRYERVWRDPLYGDVRLTAFEMAVIDTPEMQRLRYFMQLGLTYLVYDGARHSRLSHSVGSLQRVEEILTSIEQIEGVRIDADTRQAARLYGLVHDVTHVAIGHTLEDEYGLFARHDRNERRIQRFVFDTSRSRLANLLLSTEWGREVRKQFDPDSTVHARSDISELVSGPVGADVLDYINRDAYYCGLDHRVDSALLRQIRIVTERSNRDDRHLVSLVRGTYGMRVDREYALETLFDERYAMFLKVYAHKTKLKASALLAKALSLALTAGRRPAFTEEQMEWFSDADLLERVAHGRRGNDRERALIDNLRSRNLPRAVYRAALLDKGERNEDAYEARRSDLKKADGDLGLYPIEQRLEVEELLARRAGLHSDQVFIYAALGAPGFKRTQHHRFLVDDAGALSKPSRTWFDRIKALHLGLWDLWVFVDADADPGAALKLGHAAQDRFGLPNQIALPVRQDRLF